VQRSNDVPSISGGQNRRGDPMSNSRQNLIRYTLGSLLAFAAMNALAGGYFGLSGAEGVPTAWLEGSPFRDYFIPGLVLFVIVGGSFFVASIAVFRGLRIARTAAFTSVTVVFVWLAVQLSVIGYVSWMQPTTATVAAIILILTCLLKKKVTGSGI